MSARWAKKDWDAIAAGLSSGEDSDAGDVPNVLAVQRNAHRVAELLHGAVPGLDEAQMRTLPRGANTVDYLRAGLAAAARAAPSGPGVTGCGPARAAPAAPPASPRGASAPCTAPAAPPARRGAARGAKDPA